MNFAHGFGFASEFLLCDKWRLATWGLVVNLSLWATPFLPGILSVRFCSVGLTKLSGWQRAEWLEFIVESSGRKWNCSAPQRKEFQQGRRMSGPRILGEALFLWKIMCRISPLSLGDMQAIDFGAASPPCALPPPPPPLLEHCLALVSPGVGATRTLCQLHQKAFQGLGCDRGDEECRDSQRHMPLEDDGVDQASSWL